MKKKNRKVWESDLDSLSKNKRKKYEESLEVLRRMRKGETLTQASRKVRISPNTAKRYVGSAIVKKNRKFVPLENDRLLRKMRIYEDGKANAVQVIGNKTARDIAKYHMSIGILMNNKDKQSVMEQFTELRIVDYKGKVHRLETDKTVLRGIVESREEHEAFDIYVSS